MAKFNMALSCEIVDVTPELAKHLRATCIFERQRKLSDHNILRLAGEMTRGWFVPGTPITMAVLPNGSGLLLNGNHTMEAIVESGITTPITFIYLPVTDLEQAGHIYARLDLQKIRSWNDAYRAAGIEVSFNTAWLAAFGAAIRIISARFGRYEQGSRIQQSRELMIMAMDKYMPYAESYVASIGLTDNPVAKLFRRSAVFSVGLELFKFQPTKAQEFFSGAASDSGLLKGDPRRTLLNWLRANKAGSNLERQITSYAAMLAWNAFYEERELTLLRSGAVEEFRLSGTPWEPGYASGVFEVKAIKLAKREARAPVMFHTGEQKTGRGDTKLVTSFGVAGAA